MRDQRMREQMRAQRMRHKMQHQQFQRLHAKNHERNRIFFGLMVALIGVALLLRTLGLFYFNIEFSWPVILIIIGLFMCLKSGFRNVGGWVLLFVGGAFLIPPFTVMGHSSQHLAWPVGITIVGLIIAFRPRRKYFVTPEQRGFKTDTVVSDDSIMNIDITFGGRKEIITSKDFKGGHIATSFGGCEVNLIQADFTTPSIIIDCKVTFGGVELIIPAQWEVQNDINTSFGSVEDERTVQVNPNTGTETRKLLILKGSCSFGNIEIKSY